MGAARTHVHARLGQRLDWEPAGSALQETDVAGRIAGLQNLAGQGHSGRNSRRVFVNIERTVEMRDPQTLQLQLGVDGELRAKIGVEQTSVDFSEALERGG